MANKKNGFKKNGTGVNKNGFNNNKKKISNSEKNLILGAFTSFYFSFISGAVIIYIFFYNTDSSEWLKNPEIYFGLLAYFFILLYIYLKNKKVITDYKNKKEVLQGIVINSLPSLVPIIMVLFANK